MKKPSTQKEQVSSTQIEDLKKEHGRIFGFKVEGAMVCIIRKPKMKDLERAASSDPSRKSPYNFNKSIIANCTIWKDEEAMENDEIMQSVFAQLDKVVDIVEAEVEEL